MCAVQSLIENVIFIKSSEFCHLAGPFNTSTHLHRRRWEGRCLVEASCLADQEFACSFLEISLAVICFVTVFYPIMFNLILGPQLCECLWRTRDCFWSLERVQIGGHLMRQVRSYPGLSCEGEGREGKLRETLFLTLWWGQDDVVSSPIYHNRTMYQILFLSHPVQLPDGKWLRKQLVSGSPGFELRTLNSEPMDITTGLSWRKTKPFVKDQIVW